MSQSKQNEETAKTHYENFPIGTRLFPKHLRRPLYAVYAFCRHTDDLGDEGDGDRLAALQAWRDDLARCQDPANGPNHPILKELLEQVIGPFGAPLSVFDRLVEANCRDQSQTRYQTYEDLLNYCHFSANPVGEMVLYLMGDWTPSNRLLSDQICTGLQLANFWQDVSEDWLERGRLYIPLSDLAAFGLTEDVIAQGEATARWRALMVELVGRARDLFAVGQPLERAVKSEFQWDIALFRQGGLAILDQIERMRFDVLRRRPTVSKVRFGAKALSILAGLRLSSLARKPAQAHTSLPDLSRLIDSLNPITLQGLLTTSTSAQNPSKTLRATKSLDPTTLQQAKDTCEAHVKTLAGNFYQAFRWVERDKREAIFALYMFCRLADDIVDDPGPGLDERRDALATLDQNLARAFDGDIKDAQWGVGEPWMWVCLADAVRRYPIQGADLRLLVDGCRDDLTQSRYPTFKDTAGYCFKVSSVVGLLVMSVLGGGRRVLGGYALYGGLAVQLTNILRDVAEDAARDRIYIPQEDLKAFGVSEQDVLEGRYTEAFGHLMRFQIQRVKLLNQAASNRLPVERKGDQAMLESIRAIYGGVLHEIERRDGDVFSARAAVSGPKKLGLALSVTLTARAQSALRWAQYAIFNE